MLTPIEARILGSLMEKQRTTPDNYPMTLNAVVQACNQKSSREPVMQLELGEVGHAVNELRDRELIRSSFSGRAERYEQRLTRYLGLDQREQALLCVLMLRGPQTLGELRSNASRMAGMPDLAAVTSILAVMMGRRQPLVTRLPRAVGRREERFAHLLCGEVKDVELPAAPRATRQSANDERIAALEDDVRRLREELDMLWRLSGLDEQRPNGRGDG